MTDINRRQFLDRSQKTTLGLAAGMTILKTADSVYGAPANEKIILGMIGIRGRGYPLMMGFAQRPDCEFAYLSDCDTTLFDGMPPSGYMSQVDPAFHGPRAEGVTKAQGKRPKCVEDFRQVLDDKSVDALVIATPEHWHGIPTVWGCQAGKDVYVEKPPSHNCWEGRKMVEAARKYERVVQVGTQSRSAPYMIAAKKYIEEGKLGRVHLCRVVNMKFGNNFKWEPDCDPPKGFNWEIWNGPAPEHPYNPTLHRYKSDFWRYGSGDVGGDGIHQIDLARWLCGVEFPQAAYASGGRFDTEGAAETPDTLVATFDFDGLRMTIESSLFTPYMLKTDGLIRESDMFPYWPQNATRVEVYGTEGVMYVGRHGGGWQVFVRPQDRQPVVKEQMYGRFPDPEHQENFAQCVRSRQRPNADVLDGHLSVSLVHYANISHRLGGKKLVIDQQTGEFVNDPEAMKLYKREYREPWVIPEEV
jgi:predicted dehydrogenase